MAEDTVDVKIVPTPTAAPTPGGRARNGRLYFVVGPARDARAVAVQAGDILMHMTPAEAREAARALEVSAAAIDLLLQDPTLRVDPRG